MFKYGIVVIGYEKINGMQRLLNALDSADYGQDDVTLIIGIDYSDKTAVRELAEEFEWQYGEKIIKCQSEHLGLKRHILACGNYINEYNLDAVAVFEDDVMPSRDFYQYMKSATDKYYYERDIAGISLYLHAQNINADQKFQAVINGKDAFFLQYPQSWGQVWMKNQWKDFYDWYQENELWVNENRICSKELPENLMTWGEESWLKYHIKYCIMKNKYFVYPYVSHSTCFHEKGVHTGVTSNRLQVALPIRSRQSYDLPDWNEEAVCYDVFFENISLYKYIGVPRNELTVDLYGLHMFTETRYLLTCRELPYTCIRSWGEKLVPHDMNIIYNIQGTDIYLYDLGTAGENVVNLPVCKTKSKAEENCTILDKLLTCEENGISPGTGLSTRGIKSIAIYGCGVVGRHFSKMIKDTEIEIKCFIDQHTLKTEVDQIKVIRLEENIPEVDAIVITPTYDYDRIVCKLSQVFGGSVISILELIS